MDNCPKFQSTHPVWGATFFEAGCLPYDEDFNPRTPCGVRHGCSINGCAIIGFQSTHPVWGATLELEETKAKMEISIHAPRVGCDGQLNLGH